MGQNGEIKFGVEKNIPGREKGTGYFSVEGLTRRELEALRAENS
jgi:hypothetical protein